MKSSLFFLHLLCTWSIPLEELTGRNEVNLVEEIPENLVILEEPHRPKSALTFDQEAHLGVDEFTWQGTEEEKALLEEWLELDAYEDLALIEDGDERDLAWAGYYYERWGRLPDNQMDKAVSSVWDGMQANKTEWAKFKQDQFKDPLYVALEKDRKNGKITAEGRDKAYLYQVEKAVAMEVAATFYSVLPADANALVKNAFDRSKKSFLAINSSNPLKKILTRKRICAKVKSLALKAFERGTKKALKDGIASSTGRLVAAKVAASAVLQSNAVSLAASVGEFLGGQVAVALGIQNTRIQEGFSAVGAISFGAIAGATVGGPVGAAVGATIGAISWGAGQLIAALFRIGKGPGSNWAYIQTGNLPSGVTSVGTYNGNDRLRWVTYWLEKMGKNKELVMSAGQAQNASFQVYTWYKHPRWWGSAQIGAFNNVYYRDVIRTVYHSSSKYKIRSVIFYGENHPRNSGKTFVNKGAYVRPASVSFHKGLTTNNC